MMNASKSCSDSNDKEKKQKQEWPGYISERTVKKEPLAIPVPLLIMELHRLQPFFENNLPQVHVLGMPNIKIRCVEVIGIVRRIYARSKLDITIDDGTGRLQILYEYEDLQKTKEERRKIDAKFMRLEKVAKIKNLNSDHMKDLEKKWLQETKNGTLGKPFKVFEYVHVIGNTHLDFGYFRVSKREASLENAKLCKPVIFAKKIFHLTEKEYNEKLQTWIFGIVKKRYEKH